MLFVAINMCTIFKAAVGQALLHATLVIDHFYVVQLANQALTEVRAASPSRSAGGAVDRATANGSCATG
ncbi:transposase [Nonomuraea fastidiosa]|uniref:transposase n=1 Tax=Nonomuraea TaxID=83681 RepID=UPI00366C0D39